MDEAAELEGAARAFCCHGCRSVCLAIHAAGLQGFYQRTPEGEPLGPPPELPKDIELFDMPEIQQDYITCCGEDIKEINLLVEGIHCAACVWLIENGLERMPGVVAPRVNLSAKRLKLKWNDRQIHLSAILERLHQLGYAALPFDPEMTEGKLQRANRRLLYRMAFAGFTMMNLMWISIALYTGAAEGEFRSLFHWVGWALATPTLLYSGYPFFRGAYYGIRNAALTMDVPIAIGVSITYLYSFYITLTGSRIGEVYYDTVVNFLFVILVGRFLESLWKREAVSATARLLDLQPKVATLWTPQGEQVVSIRSVKVGDQVLIRPGGQVPVDGRVLEGISRVDESMLSGESLPVLKEPGHTVAAGTVNQEGRLIVAVDQVLRDTTLGQIIHLVEEAQSSKAPIQTLADRIVPWFVAITIGLGLITFAWWYAAGLEVALMAATSVLIITCPCAFGMATPMSIAVAAGVGARYGILIKTGAVLESLASIRHYVFDKTGTLSEGRLTAYALLSSENSWILGVPGQAPLALPDSVRLLLGRVGAVEYFSEHPVARAVHRFVLEQDISCLANQVTDFQEMPGLGVRARYANHELMIGSRALLVQSGVRLTNELGRHEADWIQQGVTTLHIAEDGEERILIALRDRIRPESADLLAALRADGLTLTLLSGDRRSVAESVAESLGGMDVIAEVMPQQKDAVIAKLRAEGQAVAMVGDGVNDAPALVRADVGIALGSGTDVSIASADVVLMSNDLLKVAQVRALSQRTIRTIRQNIGISILYNLIMVPLAMSAMITPLVAAISMPVSSLLVIGNAARINRFFKKTTTGTKH